MSVAIAVVVGVPAGGVGGVSFVRHPVAVIVEVVAQFHSVGVYCGAGVVAVQAGCNVALGRVAAGDRRSGGPKTVGVSIRVPQGRSSADHTTICIVGVARAVFVGVGFIAHLDGSRVNGSIGVVAVAAFRDVSTGRFAGPYGGAVCAVSVGVGIGMPVGGVDGAVIDFGVAVVVDAIADLEGSGVGHRVNIIAVGGGGDVAGTGVAGVDGGVTVAIPIAIRVGVPSVHDPFVDFIVAVVVFVVAALGRPWVCRYAGVVAVATGNHISGGRFATEVNETVIAKAVGVQVGVASRCVNGFFVDFRVAIVVDSVAKLVGTGVDCRVIIVAVAVNDGVAIAVFIEGHHGPTVAGVGRGAGVSRGVGFGDAAVRGVRGVRWGCRGFRCVRIGIGIAACVGLELSGFAAAEGEGDSNQEDVK